MNNLIRCLRHLTCALLALTIGTAASAATVDFEPIVGTIIGSGQVVVPFEVTEETNLNWLLTDLAMPTTFINLGLAITTEDVNLLGIINEPGLLEVSLAPGNYLAIVGGIAGGDLNIGTFGLEISDLPVPAAVYLFGSALLGLAGIARRRQRVRARS